MLQNIISIVGVLIALSAGFIIGYFLRKKLAQAQANSIEAKAEKMLTEAKAKQQEFILQAKEKAVKILDEAKREERQLRQELHSAQQRLERRESMFDQKILEFQDQQHKLQEKVERVSAIKQEIEKMRNEEVIKLQNISGLDRDSAKQELLGIVEQESKDELLARMMKLDKENGEAFENRAKEIIVNSIQRCASSHAAETTSSIVNLPSEEMKGRIIGKEGRNIKTI